MRLRSCRVERTPELMIIPMIDIIFFLLVFFMLSSLYMTEQSAIAVNLPKAAQARQDASPSISITVTKDGFVLVDDEEIALEAVKGKISGVLHKEKNQAVVLRADRDVDYGRVVRVLDELKAAGAARISIAAQRT